MQPFANSTEWSAIEVEIIELQKEKLVVAFETTVTDLLDYSLNLFRRLELGELDDLVGIRCKEKNYDVLEILEVNREVKTTSERVSMDIRLELITPC